MPANALPPLFQHTAEDQGAPVVVLDYIGASSTVLITAIRLFLTVAKKHPFRSDDYFSGWLLVVVTEAGLLRYLGHLRNFVSYRGPDATWFAATPGIISICIVHLSVITATIPRINSFIADMQTKKAGLIITRRDYENYKSSSKSGSNNHSGSGSRGNWSRSRSPATVLQGLQDGFRPDHQVKRTNKLGAGGSDDTTDAIEMGVRDELETGSQNSVKANAVYQKTEFRWEEEFTGPSASPRPDRHRQDST